MIDLGISAGLNWRRTPGGIWTPSDTTGLIGAYDPHTNAPGQQLTDISGNGNHGQFGSDPGADTNDPSFGDPTSIGLTTLNFDGDDYVDLQANSAGHDFNLTTALTFFVVVWLTDGSPLAATYGFIGRARGSGTLHQYEFRVSNFTPDRKQFFYYDGSTVTIHESADDIPEQDWFTMACTYKDGAQAVYLNGASVATGTDAGTIVAEDTATTLIGAHPTGAGSPPGSVVDFMDGSMGPILAYNAWKTDAQVRDMHNDIRNAYPEFGLPLAS